MLGSYEAMANMEHMAAWQLCQLYQHSSIPSTAALPAQQYCQHNSIASTAWYCQHGNNPSIVAWQLYQHCQHGGKVAWLLYQYCQHGSMAIASTATMWPCYHAARAFMLHCQDASYARDLKNLHVNHTFLHNTCSNMGICKYDNSRTTKLDLVVLGQLYDFLCVVYFVIIFASSAFWRSAWAWVSLKITHF